MNTFLEAALEYERIGYSVIPMRALDKRPQVAWTDRQVVAANENEISEWWLKFPTANVGIVTGRLSDLTVVDIDGELGEKSIRRSGLNLPRTFTVNSPRGRHLYYKYTSRLNTKAKFLPGVDVRSEGGVIVAPPSKRAEGEYVVTDDTILDELDETSIKILNSGSVLSNRPITAKLGSKVSEGSRNDTVFRMALKLLRDGKDKSYIFKTISLDNESRFTPPLPVLEIDLIVDSAWKYGLKIDGIRLAKSLVDALNNSDDRSLLFDAIPTIARLSRGEQMKCLDHLKISKLKVPITQLTMAIDEERAKIDFDGGEHNGSSDRPVVQLSGRSTKDIVDQSINYLQDQKTELCLFQIEGNLFRIDRGDGVRFKTVPMDEIRLTSALVDSVEFYRKSKTVFPPRDLLKAILGRSDLGFDELQGITNGPLWRGDGTLVLEPGFDSESGIFLSTEDIDFDPENLRSVEWAKKELESLLDGFPFVQRADLENSIALIVSLVYRPSLGASAPMFVITAPQAGTGKTLLADVVCSISTGSPAPLSPPPPGEEEMRKRITSILLSSAPVAVLDNCENAVASQSLSVALTAASWSDRILGRSESVTPPNNTSWIATGNKIGFKGDLLRRTIPIRIDSDHSTPWTRSDFKISDLRTHVLDNRNQYLEAVCVLISNWIQIGKRSGGSQTVLGGFEKWMETIDGIMTSAGFTEFATNLDEWWDENRENEYGWQAWLEAWSERHGSKTISSSKLIDLIDKSPGGLVFGVHPPPEVGDLADKDMNRTDLHKRARALGKVLGHQAGKRFGSYKLIKRRDSKTNSLAWHVDESR